jgi:hypothetical protein
LAAQTLPERFPNLDSLNIEQMTALADQLFEAAQTQERQGAEKMAAALNMATEADSLWVLSKTDSTLGKTQRDSLFLLRKSAKTSALQAEKLWKKTQQTRNLAATAANTTDSLTLRKMLPKVWGAVQKSESPQPAPSKKSKAKTAAEPVPAVAAPPKPLVPAAKKYAAYTPANDVMLHPPVPPCALVRDTRDEFSGEISRETSKAELFRHSPPALLNYLKGRTHVTCEAALSRAGATTALLLSFHINDPNARRAFGRIEQNGFAVLKFMDGSTFTLQNAIADEGLFNPESESATYKAKYPLTEDVLKKMRRIELDKIRIAWSRGFEDYDVQQVDLLLRQSACLFQK